MTNGNSIVDVPGYGMLPWSSIVEREWIGNKLWVLIYNHGWFVLNGVSGRYVESQLG